jgi:hypothetical protein
LPLTPVGRDESLLVGRGRNRYRRTADDQREHAGPLTFTPDGKLLIFREVDGASGFGVLNALPLEGERQPKPLMWTPVNSVNAAASLQQKPFGFSKPSAAFQFALPPRAGSGRLFDVSPDGQRFVAVRSIAQKDEAAQPNQLRMILNWDQELQRLAPAKR